MNSFTGLVRAGNDAEVRVISSGKTVLSFSAANTIGWGDSKSTLWLRCSYWRSAETMAPYIKKGVQLVVSGELSQSEYQANDGTTKTSLELKVTSIDFVSGQKQQQQPQAQQQQVQQAQQQAASAMDPDDAIPFNSLNMMIKNHLI